MATNQWRQRAAEAIQSVLTAHPDVTGPPLMTLLREAYPFGQKVNYPYRVWRSELQFRLGLKRRRKRPCRLDPVPPGQGALW